MYNSRLGFQYKKIRLKAQEPQRAAQIQREFKLSPIAAQVLAARGFNASQELKAFLEPSIKDSLPDPKKLVGLMPACKLIETALAQRMPIAVCCDFDVDGLSGGAQVYHFLKTLGAEVRVFVPDRFEDGYGLNHNMVKEIAQSGFGLLLTIDFGTTNPKELKLARELGLKSIVIDHHHTIKEALPVDVFINPQQKSCGFAGRVLSASGLAWYLLAGLKNTLAKNNAAVPSTREYLDLACLGTICDMVPLIGANRVIAKEGLELLTQTKRAGLRALKEVMGLKNRASCSDVSFGIGPRLNAAGRMVHGEVVIDLLTTEDSLLAKKIADRLNRLNVERQDTENLVKERALEKLKAYREIPPGLMVWDQDFHTGVIGIVAQRLVEHYYRPAIVLGMESPGIYKGSARGIKGFNVIETLQALSAHLLKCGGHEGAGGLLIKEEKLQGFQQAFLKECALRLQTEPYADADCEAALPDLSIELVDQLRSFAPFGMGNPTPQLLMRNLKVHDVRDLKGQHLKALFSDGKHYLSGLLWRQVYHPELKTGNTVNIVFRPEYSTYGGFIEIQAHLQAIERA
jgi:single-stranded-DNA-specific exonuclease